MTKVLFLLKYREAYGDSGDYSYGGMSSGLLNSAQMVSTMLNEQGLNGSPCESKCVEVLDANFIDREVYAYKPDVVIIEAVWVVPAKFTELVKLHPNVKWIIRNHSNIPFLANEGMALSWLAQYVRFKNVYIASNSQVSLDDLKDLVSQTVRDHAVRHKVVFFPNYYVTDAFNVWQPSAGGPLNVGCFGAVRPLKNQLAQAFAAIRFANKHGRHVNFHINAGRIETGGNPVVKNLHALFDSSLNTTLVTHEWCPHDDFVKLIAEMDLSMQVSFSETFNIVTADAVEQGVPVVVSKEISWVHSRYHADPNNTADIVAKMETALKDAVLDGHSVNKEGLALYNRRSHTAISNTISTVKHATDPYVK